MGAGDAGAAQGLQAGHLHRAAAAQIRVIVHVLIAGEVASRSDLVAGHLLRAAHHHARNLPAGGGGGLAHLAGVGGTNAAVSGILVGRHVFGASHELAGSGLVAGHLLGAAHLVAGHPVAVAGGADAHLGGLATGRFGLAEGLENLGA